MLKITFYKANIRGGSPLQRVSDQRDIGTAPNFQRDEIVVVDVE